MADTFQFNDPNDLSIKTAQELFDDVWAKLEKQSDNHSIAFPQRIIWLNGAPGAGKGTQTAFIKTYWALASDPIIVSNLLQTDEAKRIKASGQLVDDHYVTQVVFQTLLHPSCAQGVIVDGYPRTHVQALCLKLLYDKLPTKSTFHIVVLLVDENESIKRQLHRGEQTRAKNSNEGEPTELRPTDINRTAAAKRYQIFRDTTYSSLLTLKDLFPYHAIDANGSIDAVQNNIRKAFENYKP